MAKERGEAPAWYGALLLPADLTAGRRPQRSRAWAPPRWAGRWRRISCSLSSTCMIGFRWDPGDKRLKISTGYRNRFSLMFLFNKASRLLIRHTEVNPPPPPAACQPIEPLLPIGHTLITGRGHLKEVHSYMTPCAKIPSRSFVASYAIFHLHS